MFVSQKIISQLYLTFLFEVSSEMQIDYARENDGKKTKQFSDNCDLKTSWVNEAKRFPPY